MIEAFEKLITRFSSYELLNNLIPGAIYVVIAQKLTSFKMQTGNIWSDIVLYYFAGLVIGRIGSLVIESFLKWSKTLPSEPYSEHVKAEQKDKRISELSLVNNMYRTYSAVALSIIITVVFSYFWPLIKVNDGSKPIVIIVGCALLLVVFVKSYIKQTNYVADRIRTINKPDKENNESTFPVKNYSGNKQ